MAEWPEFKCTVVRDGIAVLESRNNLLYGMTVPGEGILFVRIVTVDEVTGRVELRCSIQEEDDDDCA